jgi:two-component system cell cycle sensor histidine kinase/response regulator CckA
VRNLALVVEDEAALRIVYRTLLHRLGFAVLEAADGEEALDLLNQHTPQLVVLDILLPYVDGRAVVDHLLATPRLHGAAVVIISSHSPFHQLLPAAPHYRFMLKPIRLTEIQTAIEQMLPVC